MAVINRDHYNSMKRQANQAESQRFNVDQEVLQKRRKLSALKDQATGLSATDLRAVQRKFDKAYLEVQKELESLREELGLKLGRQATETKREIDNVRRLAQKNQKDIDAVAKQAKELEKTVNDQIKSLAEQIENTRKKALYYFDRLEDIVQKVSLLYPDKYEILYPDQIQPGYFTLQTGLNDVLGNIEGKTYEAAISVAQTRIPEALTMLGQLEFFHNRFLSTEQDTRKKLEEIQIRFEKLQSPEKRTIAVTINEYYDDKGTDYWARELFQDILNNFEEQKKLIGEYAENNDADSLMISIQQLNNLNLQLTQCEQIEENERRLHYECMDRAFEICEELENNSGWKRITAEPVPVDEGDLRGPIYIILKNGDFHITVTCCPERNVAIEKHGRVQSTFEIFDNGLEKDDVSLCDTKYRDVIAVLRTSGIVINEDQDTRLIAVTQDAFVKRKVAEEKQSRNNWLNITRSSIRR